MAAGIVGRPRAGVAGVLNANGVVRRETARRTVALQEQLHGPRGEGYALVTRIGAEPAEVDGRTRLQVAQAWDGQQERGIDLVGCQVVGVGCHSLQKLESGAIAAYACRRPRQADRMESWGCGEAGRECGVRQVAVHAHNLCDGTAAAAIPQRPAFTQSVGLVVKSGPCGIGCPAAGRGVSERLEARKAPGDRHKRRQQQTKQGGRCGMPACHPAGNPIHRLVRHR